MVGPQDRGGHGSIPHPAPIDENGDLPPVRPGERDRADEAVDDVILLFEVHRQHLPGNIDTVKGRKDLAAVAIAAGAQRGLPIHHQLPADAWIGQGIARHQRFNLPPFGVIGLEEFEPGGDVVEQVLHGDPGALGGAELFLLPQAAPFHHHPGTCILCWRSGFNRHSGDGADRGQRLTPEAQGADAKKVLSPRQFAGGMAGDGQGQFRRRDSRAIIENGDQPLAGALHLNRDGLAAGIERILHQFLDHRSRAFNHFSRGDLTGDMVWQ